VFQKISFEECQDVRKLVRRQWVKEELRRSEADWFHVCGCLLYVLCMLECRKEEAEVSVHRGDSSSGKALTTYVFYLVLSLKYERHQT